LAWMIAATLSFTAMYGAPTGGRTTAIRCQPLRHSGTEASMRVCGRVCASGERGRVCTSGDRCGSLHRTRKQPPSSAGCRQGLCRSCPLRDGAACFAGPLGHPDVRTALEGSASRTGPLRRVQHAPSPPTACCAAILLHAVAPLCGTGLMTGPAALFGSTLQGLQRSQRTGDLHLPRLASPAACAPALATASGPPVAGMLQPGGCRFSLAAAAATPAPAVLLHGISPSSTLSPSFTSLRCRI
jgi:hypothetical protein